jgi:hypothetical protein
MKNNCSFFLLLLGIFKILLPIEEAPQGNKIPTKADLLCLTERETSLRQSITVVNASVEFKTALTDFLRLIPIGLSPAKQSELRARSKQDNKNTEQIRLAAYAAKLIDPSDLPSSLSHERYKIVFHPEIVNAINQSIAEETIRRENDRKDIAAFDDDFRQELNSIESLQNPSWHPLPLPANSSEEEKQQRKIYQKNQFNKYMKSRPCLAQLLERAELNHLRKKELLAENDLKSKLVNKIIQLIASLTDKAEQNAILAAIAYTTYMPLPFSLPLSSSNSQERIAKVIGQYLTAITLLYNIHTIHCLPQQNDFCFYINHPFGINSPEGANSILSLIETSLALLNKETDNLEERLNTKVLECCQFTQSRKIPPNLTNLMILLCSLFQTGSYKQEIFGELIRSTCLNGISSLLGLLPNRHLILAFGTQLTQIIFTNQAIRNRITLMQNIAVLLDFMEAPNHIYSPSFFALMRDLLDIAPPSASFPQSILLPSALHLYHNHLENKLTLLAIRAAADEAKNFPPRGEVIQ